MTSPIEISRYRLLKNLRLGRPVSVAQHTPNALQSDADLRPMAIVFWVASVARVALGLWQGQPFDAEGSLALLCVVGIPCWLVGSWLQRKDDSSASADAQSLNDAANVLRFGGRRS